MTQETPLAELFDGDMPPSRNAGAWGKRVASVGLLLVAAAVVVGGFLLGRGASTPTDYPGPGSGEVQVTVSRGDSLTAIAQELADSGVIMTPEAFLDAAALDDRAASIGPGTYALLEQMSGAGALQLMLDPASRAQSSLVLPEGLRLNQTFEIAAEATGLPVGDFEQVAQDPEGLGLPSWAEDRVEGFMFPATYDLVGDENARDVMKRLVERFDQAALTTDLVSRAEAAGRSPYDVLIVASLVEAEVLPEDFAKAAAVVYNRLEAGMPLQFDSTVSYALGITELQLNADQLATESPYNTYQNTGLPPTPINSPGEAAIEAALEPAKAKWLYFVTIDPDTRETKFARDYDRFLELKRQFQENVAE